MAAESLLQYMIFGALLGIVYSLKRMFLLEKKIAQMELGIGRILENIEREELRIEQRLKMKAPARKKAPAKKPAKKKAKKRRK